VSQSSSILQWGGVSQSSSILQWGAGDRFGHSWVRVPFISPVPVGGTSYRFCPLSVPLPGVDACRHRFLFMVNPSRSRYSVWLVGPEQLVVRATYVFVIYLRPFFANFSPFLSVLVR
jgi:hypothetical protein